ncbi:MAG: hypothetical protein ACJ72E_11330 [Marmoricola sp.]
MNTHLLPSPSVRRGIAAGLGAGLLLLGAAACGSSGNGNGSGSGAQGGGPESTFQGAAGSGRFPGATGKVAAVSGSTAQVQNAQDGQVAVTWNGATIFSKQVSAKLADVAVGSCVMVGSASTSAGSGGSTTAPTTAPTTISATTVRISAKGTDGTCTGGFGGGSRPQLSGNGGPPPSGAPGQLRGFGGASGEVTAVGASSFIVRSTVPGATTSTDVTVKVGTGTTYTRTGRGTASDVKVGVCVRAQGSTGSTGAVTARSVEVSPAVNGQCDGGFRRSFSGGGPGTVTQES